MRTSMLLLLIPFATVSCIAGGGGSGCSGGNAPAEPAVAQADAPGALLVSNPAEVEDLAAGGNGSGCSGGN